MSTPPSLAATRDLLVPEVAPKRTRANTLVDSSAQSSAQLVRGLASPGERHVLGGRVGRYHVREQLGEGGMGTVVEAYDETLGRRVALKLLHERQAAQDELRLLREAQALARLSHPNVVQVYEVGEIEGRLFIAMERIDGISLARWHAQARPWKEVLEVYLQAGRGLAAAHDVGLVHRDFKPSNCVIDGTGRVRVLDFGLARDMEAAEEAPTAAPDVLGAAGASRELDDAPEGSDPLALEESVTRPGTLMGTVAYMAPEQLLGLRADARSDQFAFCVSLYEALYRDSPFMRHSLRDLADLVLEGEVPLPPAGVAVPKAVWRVLRRGLARQPSARWPSMQVLLERLARVPRLRRYAGWAVGMVLGVMGTAGLAHEPSPARAEPSPAWAGCIDATLVDAAPSALDERDQVELEQTFVWAHTRGHDKVAVQAARRLSQVLAREHGEHEAAHAWQVTADAVLARASARGSCATARPWRPAGPKD